MRLRMNSSTLSLRNRALGLLARREHSRAELLHKLAPHTEDAAEITALLDDFEQQGFLSDARFAAEFVRAKSRRFGAVHIAYVLREKGVAQDIIAAALCSIEGGELERARTVWQAKFGTPPLDLAQRAKQTRFLIGRGFSGEVVRRVLRQNEE